MAGSFDISRVPVLNLLVLEFGLRPEVVILGMLCAIIGAIFLSRYTRPLGVLTYPLNCLALLGGAMAANWLMKGVQVPLQMSLEGPLLISLGGMAVAALIMLFALPRSRWHD
jgi:hypothetical protein